MQIATAYVTLRVDTKDAREKAVSETKKIGSEMSSALADAFSAVAFTKAVSGMISQASRLEQAVGGTSAVFKESATVVDQFAASSAASFGISAAAARELTSQTGALLKGFGFTTQAAAEQSVVMAKLGADLSAAFGGRPEEAVQALGAALRGEFNPAERFGVSLTAASVAARAVEMGLAETTSVVDAQAKAQATLAIIMEQTVDVQGQFARESDMAAGAAAIATAKFDDQRAKLGEQLLPIYAQAVELLSGLVGVFSEIPAPAQAAVIALGGMAAMAGPMGRVVDVAGKLKGALSGMSAAQLGAGAVIVGAAAAYSVYSQRKEEATQRTNDLREALTLEGSAQNEAIAALAQNDEAVRRYLEGQKAAAVATDELVQFVRDGTGPVAELAAAWKQAGDETNGVYPNLIRLSELINVGIGDNYSNIASVRDFIIESEKLRKAEQERANTQELVNELTGTAAGATDELTTATKAVTTATEDAGVAAKDLATQVGGIDLMFSQAAETVGVFQRALELVMGAELSMEEANRAVRDELEALTASFAENGATLDINTEAGRKNREQAQAAVESILDVAEAMVGQGKSAKEAGEAVDGMREMLLAQMETLGLSREEAEDYIKTLGLTPENVDTAIRLTKKEKAKADIEAILKEIPGTVPTEIQALIDEGKYGEALRRLRDLEDPVTVPIWLTIQNPTAMDEMNIIENRAGSAEGGGTPIVGSTAWWQGLMGLQPRPGGGTSSSGPSPERVAFDREFERERRRYSLGDLTPAEYLEILRAMRRKYRWPRLSDPGYMLAQEIQKVLDDVAEADAENTKEPGDPVGAAFDQAAADQAAIEARQARRSARRDAIATAMDPEASPAEKKRAEEAWAKAILDDLDAQANRKGMADRTVPWAKYVRRGLEKAARQTPALRDEISVLLAGIPDFTSDAPGGGGSAPPGPSSTTPGGGNSGTNRVGGGDMSPDQAGGSAVIIQSFGTERQWLEQLARKVREIQRGNR